LVNGCCLDEADMLLSASAAACNDCGASKLDERFEVRSFLLADFKGDRLGVMICRWYLYSTYTCLHRVVSTDPIALPGRHLLVGPNCVSCSNLESPPAALKLSSVPDGVFGIDPLSTDLNCSVMRSRCKRWLKLRQLEVARDQLAQRF